MIPLDTFEEFCNLYCGKSGLCKESIKDNFASCRAINFVQWYNSHHHTEEEFYPYKAISWYDSKIRKDRTGLGTNLK